ncbi:hypothetical protein CCACVL1_08532 [Corchorus capsularis]|uniref:Srp40 C-terminal domain-containing protein n=1 Tax=Corchorus capsularis TaxID=210143 RepID=A0A1R3J082_COCAP|nr:hypothetical protein CCACVL1_08532 [Corchorus capsularis]
MLASKPSPALIALKPRQVVLSSNSAKTMKNKASPLSLDSHQKSLLLLSVANFLQRNSFSKTLKKFLSEAQIQKNDLTGSSLDLEEMCCKYLAMSDNSKPKLSSQQFQDMLANGNSDGQVGGTCAVENATKKNKGGDESSKVDKSANSKKREEHVSYEASKASSDDIIGQSQLNESDKKQKEKKKKKSKVDSESHVDAECLGGESEKSKVAVSTESNIVSGAGIENKTKDKKKKKNKLTSDSHFDHVDQHGSEDKQQAVTNASDISLEDKTSKSKAKKKTKDDAEVLEEEKSKENNKNGMSKEDLTIVDCKGSKKRKRLDSVVHDSHPVLENGIEDSKRRKTESSEEQYSKLDSSVGAEKQLNNQENESIEKTVNNSAQKSSKKQQNGSVQPKKPFQRVNADEVVFVDKRLEDNSYWAKDGAEIGYGAKAQEVLGQVRGRDFRHEKTKKKRGSYRGGQIDLQSHSIKFNYSDDE